MKFNIYLTVIIFLSGLSAIQAQKRISLSYTDYLEQVASHNLGYAAEKLNLNIAEAGIEAAKIFNDPQLSVAYSNNQERKLQMGYGVCMEVSKTVSIGKRKAGIDLSRSENELTKALLADYFRNLRAEATLIYLEALKLQQLYQVKINSYDNMKQLADGDSVKFTLGTINEVDAIESKLEAGILYNELQQTRTELDNAYSSLGLMAGIFSRDTLFMPRDTLSKPICQMELAQLIDTALSNRTDLTAALKNIEVARKGLKVTRRERNMDIDLAVGVSKNAQVHNEEAPAPPFTGFTASIGVPLKFSNFYKGDVKAAQYREQQFELQYREARIQVQTEVMQAFRQYKLLEEQVNYYEKNLLERASQVIDRRIYSYNRGEASLHEVLDAQRIYDEVRILYIENLFNLTSALVNLECKAGIWDIKI